jgi:hypothetical protein
MPKPYEQWTVTPHGPIEKVSENLWRVGALIPGAPLERTMLVARLASGELVIYNAIALGDAEMKELEAWGTPAWLVVANHMHRLDARIFKARYPALRVVAPAGARAKVEEVVKVDTTNGDFGDAAVTFDLVAGTDDREAALAIRTRSGAILALTDAIMNMRSLPGFAGFMMGLSGFTGKAPKVTLATKFALMTDKKAFRADLEKRADTPNLVRVEVAHGAPIVDAPGAALRAAVASL